MLVKIIGRLFLLIGILGFTTSYAQSIPFSVNKPDKVITLDEQLKEISGIIMNAHGFRNFS